jgi:LuxR family transcriptional regulator, maltose regulon positive regulatory protein
VLDNAHIEAQQRPERELRALAASRSRRVGVDVPIESKLHAPTPRMEWVARPELVRSLADASAKLVLVDAPAGFGKTTLVAQWRSSTAEVRQFAWLSLDRGDDDPGRLWWYVVCALQRSCPGFDGGDILRTLRVQAPDITGEVLPLLLNDLAALAEPVVLVLDDYHVIQESRCHDQLAFLLLHLPPAAQVVLITRADPPLPLARMRAAGELAEFRARQLRFTPGHAAVLVRAISAAELGEPDMADLVERSEGWPTGVFLAALSLRGHPSPAAFVRQFTGNNRFIVDFLAEEVLGRQSGKIRQFLARTSILGRFCAPICDAVVGSADAREIIDVLDRENLFVVPLDEDREWFRYHHLFAQVLRSELARTEPDAVRTLHQRASAWHRQSGSADEAIGHALAAGDITGTVDLIGRHWYSFVDSGQVATVRGWMRSLGDDVIAADPVAAHCAAWAAAFAGDRESVRRLLPVVAAAEHDGPLPDGIRSPQFSAALLQATFGFEGIGPMRQAGARAVTLEGDQTSPWFALARAAFGLALYFCGDLEGAAAQVEAAQLSGASIALARMLSFAVMSLIAVEKRKLDQAGEYARAACDIADAAGLSAAPQSSLAYAATGAFYVSTGQLDAARSEFERALRSRRRWPGISPWATVEILLRLAPVQADLGDRLGAAALLAEARQVLTALPDGAEAQLARLGRLEHRLTARPPVALPAEPLTEREVAVLRLLRGTLSLREIGQQLYLSQNTIKTHTQAIYRKLGVSGRQDAVAKGREIDIL